MRAFRIESAVAWMTGRLDDLCTEATAAGIGNMAKLVSDWESGRERFGEAGESLLVAISDESPVGVGGISRCPTVPGAFRMRRFYVSKDWRRSGVASGLALQLIEQGFRHSQVLTCNATASPAAPLFWVSMGFQPTDRYSRITHVFESRVVPVLVT
jgi:GNAT superfamily N-acetyltransferase